MSSHLSPGPGAGSGEGGASAQGPLALLTSPSNRKVIIAALYGVHVAGALYTFPNVILTKTSLSGWN